ncbi:DUF4369 domain-containing protein [Hanstruepera marina]|uniref:DUF4369 domain-containing protein n=1 Tax=Hanstruepera marina TaxID=2873265 RepID=UPI001CA6F957|nr:DUF4369 domain-containing protein [Hanstruepera marina]
MRNLITIIIALLIVSCSSEKQYDLTVKGQVKGLKKGTLYLQKVKDSTLISVDSLIVNGDPTFELHSDLETPEVFYLHLNKTNSDDKKIAFFADKGITEINTTLKDFVFDADIKGSKQQEKLDEYKKVMSRFNDRSLELIKEEFEAKTNRDSIAIAENQKAYESLLKGKYLYTVNFAINNKDSEVAPYVALTEIYDAKIKWLDTINNALNPEIKSSKYGLMLDEFIKDRKSE